MSRPGFLSALRQDLRFAADKAGAPGVAIIDENDVSDQTVFTNGFSHRDDTDVAFPSRKAALR
jgi:hypothetical protein